MNNLKNNNNNNYIKSYFAFVLMVFAVFSGSNIGTVMESTEGARSLDFYAVRTGKIIQYNDYVVKLAIKRKLHLLSNKTKTTIINSLKDISPSTTSMNTAIITIITAIMLILLFIYYYNNGIVKNNIWLSAVY